MSLPISDPGSMELLDWLLVCGCSVASIVATLLIIPASRLATPTIVNMVRSTELLFAYAAEFVLFGMAPEPAVAGGAALVLGSITTMTLADKIQRRLDRVFRRSGKSDELSREEQSDDESHETRSSPLLLRETPLRDARTETPQGA